jgi:hypothetical protein
MLFAENNNEMLINLYSRDLNISKEFTILIVGYYTLNLNQINYLYSKYN